MASLFVENMAELEEIDRPTMECAVRHGSKILVIMLNTGLVLGSNHWANDTRRKGD